jgi:type I restriction enzyme M protein
MRSKLSAGLAASGCNVRSRDDNCSIPSCESSSNSELYKTAYSRYIERNAVNPDEINPKEFSPERVKTVVKELQGMAITRGAALHGDVIGAFFEEILRAGFKQDKGMYFTHDNLVYFILEALDLEGLTIETWKKATHPENRLPYVIDPACGAGTFLLRAMYIITNTIRSRKDELVSDMESMQYFRARMSEEMPNNWAESFLYGLDPKFVMAITAKVNMVLHGDGSAHIFKYDSLSPLSSFADDKLKPLSDPHRTIPKARYKADVSESFDVVVSNPPFGITIAANVRALLPSNFSLRDTTQSECYFLERWFQLLKPKGRLGVVLPESLLNTAEAADVRLFLYRVFWIRAIVALPRNLFIETPTLTSLLFAQKKTASEIEAWDNVWAEVSSQMEEKVKQVKEYLKTARRDEDTSPQEVEERVIDGLSRLISRDTQIIKKGGGPVSVSLPGDIETTADACNYYRELLKLAGFNLIIRNHVFARLCERFNYEYPVYLVDEVGYKLSKRKERLRPNQLCRFVGASSKREMPNLHLADEPFEVSINTKEPQRVLDFIRRDVKWA